tara:strand:- start:281 stop:901 length:621 start_codon:yes stop_codon:yes gene_type:complete
MNCLFLNKITYQFISKILVYPIFKFLFRGELDGSKNIPDENSFIIVSNHGSLLDPPFLGHALGRKVSFMAKQELFNIPILSQIIKACGAYPVKRGVVDKNSIILASKKLFNNQIIGIFIDGTRQKNGFVNNPKNGAALIASKTKKILLPVAITNSHRLVRFKFFLPFFSKVTIKIGKPINYPLSSSKIDITETTIKLKNQINFLLS